MFWGIYVSSLMLCYSLHLCLLLNVAWWVKSILDQRFAVASLSLLCYNCLYLLLTSALSSFSPPFIPPPHLLHFVNRQRASQDTLCLAITVALKPSGVNDGIILLSWCPINPGLFWAKLDGSLEKPRTMFHFAVKEINNIMGDIAVVKQRFHCEGGKQDKSHCFV